MKNYSNKYPNIVSKKIMQETQRFTESIDIVKPSEASKAGVALNYISDTPTSLKVQIKIGSEQYTLTVHTDESEVPEINFGVGKKIGNLDQQTNTNSPNSRLLLATITGLVKDWLEKHNITYFKYGTQDNMRKSLYALYLKKHLPNYKVEETEENGKSVYMWHKQTVN